MWLAWVGLGVILTVGDPPALPEVPPPPCPLASEVEGFEVPRAWKRHRLRALKLRLSTPPGWTLRERDAGWDLSAPGGQARLRVRRHPNHGANAVSLVRRHLEAWRLGPSVTTPACQQRLRDRLTQVTGWSPLEVGVYRRPLGERRQSYGLFIDAGPAGVVEIRITVYWRDPAPGPPLGLVRALLSGVRPMR